VRCTTCGNDNPDEFPFCIECGCRIEAVPLSPSVDDGRRPLYDERRPVYDEGRDPYGQRRPQYDDGRPPYADPRPVYDERRPAYEEPPRRTEPRTARLVLESGLGKSEYSLDAPVVTIGRSRSNDISLDDARVSRHHARIVRDDQGYLLEDLNSRNGTRVDDRAVRDSCLLADGALIQIGDSTFRFVMSAPARSAPAPREAPRDVPRASPQATPRQAPGQDESTPVIFLAPWTPVQCPTCQGLRTMRPIVYGQAVSGRAAQEAARRGDVVLGEGAARPDGPNADCRACGTRVRIVPTSA
jgi:pSer/pThr/pTyr-binding forkhead associated (FHA) protein